MSAQDDYEAYWARKRQAPKKLTALGYALVPCAECGTVQNCSQCGACYCAAVTRGRVHAVGRAMGRQPSEVLRSLGA
jgi:hypothetical protein